MVDPDSQTDTEIVEAVEVAPLNSPMAGTVPFPPRPPKQKNTMGVIGLCMAIGAIIGFSPLAPFAVIVSVIAMKRSPKELAIGGFILGAFSTVMLFWGAIIMYVLVSSTASIQQTGTDLWKTGQTRISVQSDAWIVAQAWREGDTIPTQAEGDKLIGATADGWGNALYYEIDEDGKSFLLRSHGPDEKPNTIDDIISGPFFDPSEVTEY